MMTGSQHRYCFSVDRVVMTGCHHGNDNDDWQSSKESLSSVTSKSFHTGHPSFSRRLKIAARKYLREQQLNKQGGPGFFEKNSLPEIKPRPPKKTGPDPAKKRIRLSCLKVTIVAFVKKKKIWLHIPLKKNSRFQCVPKKIFRPKEKSPPLLI